MTTACHCGRRRPLATAPSPSRREGSVGAARATAALGNVLSIAGYRRGRQHETPTFRCSWPVSPTLRIELPNRPGRLPSPISVSVLPGLWGLGRRSVSLSSTPSFTSGPPRLEWMAGQVHRAHLLPSRTLPRERAVVPSLSRRREPVGTPSKIPPYLHLGAMAHSEIRKALLCDPQSNL